MVIDMREITWNTFGIFMVQICPICKTMFLLISQCFFSTKRKLNKVVHLFSFKINLHSKETIEMLKFLTFP